MKLFNKLSFSLLASATIIHSAAIKRAERGGSLCKDMKIPVKINSQNIMVNTEGKDLNSGSWLRQILFSTFENDLGGSMSQQTTVDDTYMVAARYCKPETKNETRANTVQMLVHGITYSKDYWSGLGPPGKGFDGNTYSYIAYASKQGYPTLSVDRLGNGDSDRPDGIGVVQINSQAEMVESIGQSLKAGDFGGKSFDKVLYVGHSYGSMVGNIHAAKYPNTFDSYLLTGFSSKIRSSLTPTLITGGFLPAKAAFPEVLGNQDLPYFAASSVGGVSRLFFVENNTDSKLLDRNFQQRGTVTAGEFISGFEIPRTAEEYKGRVMIFNGQNDAIFCSPDNFGMGTSDGKGDCGSGDNSILAQTGKSFPAAKSFDYMTIPDTGHCNILHKNAQKQFEMMQSWIGAYY